MTTDDIKFTPNPLFKKYIILILAYVYNHTPSAVRFDQALVEELTGYKFKSNDQEKVVDFCKTIDFLKREGYIRCNGDYVQLGSVSDHQSIVFSLPVYISKEGIISLEKHGEDSERFIDKFNKFSSSIAGKVAENVLTEKINNMINIFLNMF
jgi:hypothetical protein